MRGFLATAVAVLLTLNTLLAQSPFDKPATDAFVITRMVEKFHLQPKAITKEFSATTFDRLLESLDDEKIFFLQEDIRQLLPYRSILDQEVLSRKTAFLKLVADAYEKRLRQVDTMIDNLTRSSFEFNTPEKLTVAEDTAYAATPAAHRSKIRKWLKGTVLLALLEDVKEAGNMSAVQQKKMTDSLEVVYRKKIQSTLKRSIKKQLESPGGIPAIVGNAYCQVIATFYDPHTNYFSLTAKENFESDLGQKAMVFGFGLDEDNNGNIVITNLKPGSPAYKSGQLNEGDRILSVKWEGRSAIDVSDASLRELSSILDASNHDKVKFTVQKADGSKREVELAKAQMEDDNDDDKVKSFLLRGAKTVGYISLPAFYHDWENEDNVNGCANDVAKEILKLKKENIDALVIDLRYNGGGSVQEAIELSGIFIDAGPVGMQKDRNTKVYTYKDVNRGTMYNGPLFIMVNGYSASASELVAGTLQDYNRAIIIGSPTYGKATSQVMFPMDTTISLEKDFSKKKTESYIKITLSKLYRVTGTTAQFSGVQPDVLLPDISDANPQREQHELFAIPATGIEGNKFFKPLSPLNKSALQSIANNIIDTSGFFRSLSSYTTKKKASLVKTDLALSWKEALQQSKLNDVEAPSFDENKTSFFSVVNNKYEQQRLQSNKDLQQLYDTWKSFLEKDPYLQVTYQLITNFINKP